MIRRLSHNRVLAVMTVCVWVMAAMLAGCGPSPEADYAKAVSEQSDRITAAFSDMGKAFDELAADETLIDDAAWIARVKASAEQVKSSHQALMALTPPDNMKEVHTSLTGATRDCSDAMDSMIKGIDDKDFDQLQNSIDLVQSCAAKLDETSKLVK